MSYVEEKEINLKDGSPCTIRTALPKDGSVIAKFREEMATTSKYLINLPGENKRGSWKERGILNHALKADNLLCLAAYHNGHLLGFLDTSSYNRTRTRHVVEFGIGIKLAYRNSGLGKEMVKMLVDWAKANSEVTKLELHVHADNEAARGLYESLGFEIEGCRKNAIKYKNGVYMDDIIMGLVL